MSVRTFVILFYYSSSFGSRTVITYGSGSATAKSYNSGSATAKSYGSGSATAKNYGSGSGTLPPTPPINVNLNGTSYQMYPVVSVVNPE